jgi:hypothetical protein
MRARREHRWRSGVGAVRMEEADAKLDAAVGEGVGELGSRTDKGAVSPAA